MGLGPQVADIVEFLKSNCGSQPKEEESSEPVGRPKGTHPNKTTTNSSNGTQEKKEPEVKPKLNKTIKFEYDDGYVPKKEVILEG
jgi:hypothetical protein